MYFVNGKDPYKCSLFFGHLPEDHTIRVQREMSLGEGNCKTLVKQKNKQKTCTFLFSSLIASDIKCVSFSHQAILQFSANTRLVYYHLIWLWTNSPELADPTGEEVGP